MVSTPNWYLSAKYALYVTWAYEGSARGGTPRPHVACGCYPDGSLPGDVNEIADALDVGRFAEDCRDMGVEYVNFTAYHAHMYVLYPSRVVESRLPGHTSRRDVVGELADALHRRGIKLQLYIHATIGDTMTEEERARLRWHDKTGGYLAWNDFFNEFFGEMAARYRNRVDSYYIDMIFDDPYLDMIDRKRIRETLLAHDPHVVITGNGEANETVDYSSREDCDILIPEVEQRLAFPVQTVVCLSNLWWSTAPATSPRVAKYDAEHLMKYLVLTAGANVGGGGMAIGASPYVTGGFEPGIKETMVALDRLVEPVSESIKNTYASSSYITPAGASIPTLHKGIVATRSVDDRYEYVHVLVPPVGSVLELPPPLDGRRFASAVMLRSGRAAELHQDECGVRIVVPEAWDRLDTVIRLAVASIPRQSFASFTLPHADMRVIAGDGLPGHEAGKAIDDDPATFWCTNEGVSHSLVLDLGETHRVQTVRVLPRQDGFSRAELCAHISLFAVSTSLDGTHFRPVATGEWKRTGDEKRAAFPPTSTRYLRLDSGPGWLPPRHLRFPRGAASAAEINVDAARS